MSRKVNSASVGAGAQFGTHSMGHIHLTSLDFGRIQPLLVQDCVPNDQIKLNMLETVITSAINAAPIQGRCIMHLAAFYIPNRVVWNSSVYEGDSWNEYITGLSSVPIPSFGLNQLKVDMGTLSGRNLTDFIAFHSGMGINPTLDFTKRLSGNTSVSLMASLLPYRAYRRVWWDWFRNSNVIPDSQFNAYNHLDSDPEDISEYKLPNYACWEKDYLTNNLRSPSLDPETYGEGTFDRVSAVSGVYSEGTDTDGTTLTPYLGSNSSGANDTNLSVYYPDPDGRYNTINAFRVANALQLWVEKINVLGGRMRDRLRGMFGSSVQPETLQMSEYLGSTSFPINFEQSAANINSSYDGSALTTPFGHSDPQNGQIKGQLTGQSSMTTNGLGNINYHCKEHGTFMVVGWLMPEPFMFHSLSPMWLRGVDGVSPSRFDFLTPEFVNTGFEPMYMYEACLPTRNLNTPSLRGTYDPLSAIGYRGKYSSYTYNMDRIGGCFIDSRTAASMRPWWLGRDLLRESGVVNANGDWISGKTGSDIMNGVNHDTLSQTTPSTMQAYDDKFMVTSSSFDHFVCHCKIDLTMVRPIPSVAVPRIETVTAQPHEFGGTRL